MPKRLANQVTDDCLMILQCHGFMAWRQNNHGTPRKKNGRIVGLNRLPKGSRYGVPDIVAIEPGNGRFWGVEVKTPRDKMSEEQERFRDDVVDKGGIYINVGTAFEVLEVINERLA